MQLRFKVLAMMLAAAALSCGSASIGSAATLGFSGGVTAPPTDMASYLRHVYCERRGPGAASRDADCRAVVAWMARNSGRAPGGWSPPPILR